jgi:hypothetical protein
MWLVEENTNHGVLFLTEHLPGRKTPTTACCFFGTPARAERRFVFDGTPAGAEKYFICF